MKIPSPLIFAALLAAAISASQASDNLVFSGIQHQEISGRDVPPGHYARSKQKIKVLVIKNDVALVGPKALVINSFRGCVRQSNSVGSNRVQTHLVTENALVNRYGHLATVLLRTDGSISNPGKTLSGSIFVWGKINDDVIFFPMPEKTAFIRFDVRAMQDKEDKELSTLIANAADMDEALAIVANHYTPGQPVLDDKWTPKP